MLTKGGVTGTPGPPGYALAKERKNDGGSGEKKEKAFSFSSSHSLASDNSNRESHRALHSLYTVCFTDKVILTFKSVDETA